MALNFLKYTMLFSRSLTAKLAATATFLNPATRQETLSAPQVSVGNDTGLANNAAGGGDTCLSQLFTLAASATTTISLASFTDALGQSAQAMARVKTIEFHHVSVADDATNGKTSTQVTIGNAGVNPFPMFLGLGTHTIKLLNGDYVGYGTRQAAGIVVGAAINILVTNNDGANQAAVLVTITGGST